MTLSDLWPFVLKRTFRELERDYVELAKDRNAVRAALKKASKNDHHDPKTGRFIKG